MLGSSISVGTTPQLSASLLVMCASEQTPMQGAEGRLEEITRAVVPEPVGMRMPCNLRLCARITQKALVCAYFHSGPFMYKFEF